MEQIAGAEALTWRGALGAAAWAAGGLHAKANRRSRLLPVFGIIDGALIPPIAGRVADRSGVLTPAFLVTLASFSA